MSNVIHVDRKTGAVTLGRLTASQLIATDASKALSSISDLTAFVAGTANQITVTDDTDGTVTLSLAGGAGDLSGLTPTDGNFIVGDGDNWVAESGNTARTSLGLGAGDKPTWAGITNTGYTTCAKTIQIITDSNIDYFKGEVYTSAAATSCCGFLFSRARDTEASPDSVINGDRLFFVVGRGHDGTTWQNPIGITGKVDGAVSSGVVPGRLAFETGSSGGTRLERLVIDYTGMTRPGLDDAYDLGVLGGTNYRWRNLYVSDTVRADTAFNINGTDGFTGTGAYNNFTIVGGIITGAS